MSSLKPRQPCRAGRRGFTLVELIISAAVMALVLAAAYGCLQAGVAGRRTVEWRSTVVQQARVALVRMAADLRSACPMEGNRQFVGQSQTGPGRESDMVDFATHHYTPQRAREGDVCEVSYFLEPDSDSDEQRLWRRRDASPDDMPLGGGIRELIATGLRGLRLEYYDGLYWHDEWGDPEGRQAGRPSEELPLNATGMPEAVRITVWVPGAPPGGMSDTNAPAAALMFQTVARLNLAPLAAYQSVGGSASDGGSADGGGAP